MSRRTVPKCQQTISETRMKDNTSYMSIFPLQKLQLPPQSHPMNQFDPMLTNRMINDQQLIQNVRNMIRYDKIQQNPMNNYFKSITTKSMISKKPLKPFMQQYPLNDNERLKVCQTKVFVLKNYVNYLQDEQIEKAMYQIKERNTNLENIINQQKYEHYFNSAMNENNYNYVPQPLFTSKIRKQQEILDPKHIKFEDRTESFEPKQKKRMQMSRKIFTNNTNVRQNSYGNNYDYQYY